MAKDPAIDNHKATEDQGELVFFSKPKKPLADASKSVKVRGTWFYVGLVEQIGFTVCVPIVVGAFIGVYLDRQWSTYPKATLLLIFVGLGVSIVSFIRIIRDIIKG